MTLLKNKVFILVIVLVLFLIAAVLGFKAFSLYSFNSLTKELDSGNAALFTSFKTEIKVVNKINENLLKSADFGPNFSKERNSKFTSQAKADYDKSLKDYKKGLDELESKSADLAGFTNLPLWLKPNQKKFATDINSAYEEYLEARKQDYNFQIKAKPIFNNEIQITEDAFAFIEYGAKVVAALGSAVTVPQMVAAFGDDISDIESLKRYSESGFKFDGQDELSSEFPTAYKEFDDAKKAFGQIYILYTAIAGGDAAKIEQVSGAGVLFNTWIASAGNSLLELNAKSKPGLIKIKDAYVSYTKVLDFFTSNKLHENILSKEKVLAQNNQNKLTVFTYITKLYLLETGMYPAARDFSSLITTLKTGNHFDESLKYNEDDFTYTSSGPTHFEIGHKDEVSGQRSTIDVGVKADAFDTLGASTQEWSVKVKKQKINLEFVGDLINSFDSLLPTITR